MRGVPGESLPCDGQYHYQGNVCFAIASRVSAMAQRPRVNLGLQL
jgi:hypothetical protein